MKKLSILAAMALALGFTACDAYEEPNPPIQQNPQESAFKANNLTMAGPAEGAVINLIDLNAANQQAQVASYTIQNFPAGYTTAVDMEIALDDTFAKTATTEAALTDGYVTVAPDALQAAYYSLTKDPAQATVYARYKVYAGPAGSDVKTFVVGGPDHFYGPFAITIKPFDAAVTIEDTYYLVSSKLAEPLKLDHSSLSPYDDPMFTALIVDAPADMDWQVVPASALTSKAITYSGDKLTGTLEKGAEAGVLTISGPVKFDFNMETLKYSIYEAYPFLYTPGDANGWSQENSGKLATTDYVNYAGYTQVGKEFKISIDNWDVSWGPSAEEGVLLKGTNDNITVATPGCYWLTFNISTLAYTNTLIETIGVIGDGTPGGWDAETRLTQSAENPMLWVGDIDFTDGSFKFRMNENWDINLGGNLLELTPGGDNMATPGAGKYTVTLDLSVYPYTATVVAK